MHSLQVLAFLSLLGRIIAAPTCSKTSVAILGAGAAGITAAQTLSNASIHDFLIVETQSSIGGRVKHTTFGKNAKTGQPFVIEEGANWVQGTGSGIPGSPENPVWTLAKKYKVANTYSNYSSILTYDQHGFVDYSDKLDDWENSYSIVEQNAGDILTKNLQDMTVRAGFDLVGYNTKRDMQAQAAEWWSFDFEYAFAPELSSMEYAVVNYNSSFYQWSEANQFVIDQRGFNAFIVGEANSFLKPNDPRLLLNTTVKEVSYCNSNVIITMTDNSCIQADYAIMTFSLGVLQNNVVQFKPALPAWKQQGISTFAMGTYTKIFYQFPKAFWDTNTQFFLYADPITRGYFPLWQSLDGPGFFPGSGIIFCTVVDYQSYAVENQDDDTTMKQGLAVLRKMFPNATIPEPTAFYYPRWFATPWAHGSYSNWPPGVTLEMHQNLRANVDRLWFAGEAMSAEYFGFLQGAYTEGKTIASNIANLINGKNGSAEVNYPNLKGTTPQSEYVAKNGWEVSTFLTYGDD